MKQSFRKIVGLKGLLLLLKRKEFRRIFNFEKFTLSAIINVRIRNWQLAANQWVKAVSAYKKKSSILFYKEHDRRLENVIYRISEQISVPVQSYNPGKKRILYLCSNIYNSGGHTRVIYDFLCNHNKDEFEIFFFSTEILKDYDSTTSIYFDKIKNRVKEAFISKISYSSFEFKVIELVNYVVRNEIGTVLSFEHANDVVALCSLIKLRKINKTKLIYYHHQNLHLSVFPDIFDNIIEILDELLPFYQQHFKNVCFMELPAVITEKKKMKTERRKDDFTILTAISFYKMFLNYSTCFADMVISILKAMPDIKYLIVVDNNMVYIDLLLDYFIKHKVSERVEIKTNITDLNLLYDDYNLYLDSIPIGGGKTILEMMTLGKPCLIYEGKDTIIKQNRSLDFIKVKNLNYLIDTIYRLKTDHESGENRTLNYLNHIKSNHSPASLTNYLENIIRS